MLKEEHTQEERPVSLDSSHPVTGTSIWVCDYSFSGLFLEPGVIVLHSKQQELSGLLQYQKWGPYMH